MNKDLRCRMVTWVHLDFIIYFELFLQVNKDLRCRMVTWVYLDFTVVTSPPTPLSVKSGGGGRRGVRGDPSLTYFYFSPPTPSINVKILGLGF